MAPRLPKFSILEIDGAELGIGVEYEPVIEDIYYDASKLENLKSVIDDIFLGYRDFFQYKLDRDFTVPALRSKVVTSEIEVNQYCLIVEGILEIT